MEIISHEEFGKLRLAQFLPAKKIRRSRSWELMDLLWVGESYRGTAVTVQMSVMI